MNLFYLRYFVTLARVKHYTRAAKQLCISQPSLSHAITQLEKELGVPLFEKNGRNTELTRFGEEFLSCAEHTLSTLDEGILSLRRGAQGAGVIRLGFLRALGVEYIPQLASRFLSQNAGKGMDFTFHTGSTGQLLEGLLARRFDLVFCSQPPAGMEVTAIPVGRQDIVLIVPNGHPLAGREEVALSETLAYPQIFFSPGSGMRDIVDDLFQQTGGKPEIAYETEEDQVIAGLVAQGFGIAVVPYMDMLRRLDLSVISITAPAWERNFYMVHNNRIFLTPAVKRFCSFVKEEEGKFRFFREC